MRQSLNPVLRTSLRFALGTLCAYELIALMPNPIPPVTTIVHKYRNESFVCKILVWAWLGLVAWHLLFEQDPEIIRLDNETVVLLQ